MNSHGSMRSHSDTLIWWYSPDPEHNHNTYTITSTA
jgi:hypothetical protein